MEGKPIPKGSRLRRLTPYLDPQDGLLRAEGRIRNAPISYNTKHLIILDAKSTLGHLIIADYHDKLAHGPPDGYWLLCGKPAVKRYSHDCL